MSKHQSPPALRLSWILRAPDTRHDEDLGFGNESTPSVPSVWGVPLKYISLVTLAVQNSALTLIMHYSRISTPPSRAYSAATAVLMNEILKGLISLTIAFARIDPVIYAHDSAQAPYHVLVGRFDPRSVSYRLRKLFKDIFSPDCWKLSIPAILYVIQNNLQYVAASNLDAATFQVTYQMKILTTAGFSVLLLRRKLFPSQWLALFFLAIGVGVVQLQATTSRKIIPATSSSPLEESFAMNGLKGFAAVALACFTSGLAGVYFEMVLKNSQADLWVRNVQLSLFSLLPAMAPVLISHAQNAGSGLDATASDWFSTLFRNFGPWAYLVDFVTAMVIKYSDNILKGFATSLSIVLSFLASIALFDFTLTATFIIGSTTVLGATWLYNQPPKRTVSNLTIALSAKDPTGWHVPLSASRNEKVKDDPFSPRSATPAPTKPDLSAVSSSSSLWSLLSTPPDSSGSTDSGDATRPDTIYP
ncbi:nucleotide-sugar transporter-domain-containing protein [Amanita rubescens]|nr:nucleotide-sugar transporter-domain-containing protein [Amanita rubescens]